MATPRSARSGGTRTFAGMAFGAAVTPFCEVPPLATLRMGHGAARRPYHKLF